MASKHHSTVAARGAAIIEFPERNKGRKRRCNSMDAAGFLTMLLLDRDGEAIPDNVRRIDEPKDSHLLPDKSEGLLMATIVWSVLTAEQREQVMSTVRCMAYDRSDDDVALRLYNLLMRRR